MALTQADLDPGQTVEQLQNSTPTDWSRYDAELHQRSSGDANRFKDDHKLHVRFYMAPMLDREASAIADRAIFRQTEMVEIMMPGEKNNIIRDVVWDQHRQRFPEKYRAFKAGASQDSGSPLTVLPFLDDSRIKELEFFNIRTVEQLAGMADTVKQRFMGGDRLSQQAQEWLDKFNSGGELRKALDAKETELEALRQRLSALEEKLQAPPQGKKG